MRHITTPVALIFFRRPSTTVQVMERIRQARPAKLLLVCDGPRPEVTGEAELVERTQRDVEAMIDWDCDIQKNYSKENTGLFKGLPIKLNWIFNQVDRAIVLEDDCVPVISFFRYCEELLEYYSDDERIMHISGNNFQRGKKRGNGSYYFSRYTHIWGWATWRRAWKYFEPTMSQLPEAISSGWLRSILPENTSHFYWSKVLTFNRGLNKQNRGPVWDNCWLLSCWLQNGLSILPNTNLVTNIGYGADGTHQFSKKNRLLNIPTHEMEFPLRHPNFIVRDCGADQFTQRDVFLRGLAGRLGDRLARIWRR